MRPFHPQYILEALPQLVLYLPVTVGIVIGTVFFGSLLGVLLAAGRIRRVLLFLVYYGLPELLIGFGININDAGKGFFVITTFSLLFAASMAEVFRSAYEAVDRGQREAAVSIGLTEFQAFYRIVLPQSVRVAIPNFTNALVNLMKEGSLAYTIGLIDIMGKGQLLIGQNHGSYSLEVYLALFILYWTLTLLIEKGADLSERRLWAEKGREGGVSQCS